MRSAMDGWGEEESFSLDSNVISLTLAGVWGKVT